MRVRAAQDAGVQHPRQREIIHEAPAARHVPRRFLAAQAPSYVHDRRRAAASFTASTICT